MRSATLSRTSLRELSTQVTPTCSEVPRGTLSTTGGCRSSDDSGLAVITRDMRIRYRPVEKRPWVDARRPRVRLTGRKSQSTDDSLAILERHWERIEELLVERPAGPWMYLVTDRRLIDVKLGSR